jgi:hypothetical protein
MTSLSLAAVEIRRRMRIEETSDMERMPVKGAADIAFARFRRADGEEPEPTRDQKTPAALGTVQRAEIYGAEMTEIVLSLDVCA